MTEIEYWHKLLEKITDGRRTTMARYAKIVENEKELRALMLANMPPSPMIFRNEASECVQNIIDILDVTYKLEYIDYNVSDLREGILGFVEKYDPSRLSMIWRLHFKSKTMENNESCLDKLLARITYGSENRRAIDKTPYEYTSRIRNVYFNDPVTVVIWNDGTKTIVRAENEEYDPEKGLAMAICKKVIGNKGNYYNVFRRWLPKKPDNT